METGRNAAEINELQQAVDLAREISGLCFAVYIGELSSGRASAVATHATLTDPLLSVLIALDPGAKCIEIVTGISVAHLLDDRSCEFAILAMRSCLVADDLVGGVREGMMLLAGQARVPKVLHTELPAV